MDERPAVRGMWIFSIVWLGRLVSFLGSSLTTGLGKSDRRDHRGACGNVGYG
jgi:hypothetical protein